MYRQGTENTKEEYENMNLILLRKEFRPDCTIGAMNDISSMFFCHTLERPYIEDKAKEMGSKCAIAEGRYRIGFVTSPKFAKRKWYQQTGRVIPEILNVPGRGNILIHVGNYPRDTDGCVLVGNVLGMGEIWGIKSWGGMGVGNNEVGLV